MLGLEGGGERRERVLKLVEGTDGRGMSEKENVSRILLVIGHHERIRERIQIITFTRIVFVSIGTT